MSRTDPQVNFRMPSELKAKLEETAAQHKRSTTAELIARLETTFELDDVMAEMRAGDHRGAVDMLLSVTADNDRMTASGEQTFSTTLQLLDQLLEKKLAPIMEALENK